MKKIIFIFLSLFFLIFNANALNQIESFLLFLGFDKINSFDTDSENYNFTQDECKINSNINAVVDFLSYKNEYMIFPEPKENDGYTIPTDESDRNRQWSKPWTIDTIRYAIANANLFFAHEKFIEIWDISEKRTFAYEGSYKKGETVTQTGLTPLAYEWKEKDCSHWEPIDLETNKIYVYPREEEKICQGHPGRSHHYGANLDATYYLNNSQTPWLCATPSDKKNKCESNDFNNLDIEKTTYLFTKIFELDCKSIAKKKKGLVTVIFIADGLTNYKDKNGNTINKDVKQALMDEAVRINTPKAILKLMQDKLIPEPTGHHHHFHLRVDYNYDSSISDLIN
jgi:hypothetical protein